MLQIEGNNPQGSQISALLLAIIATPIGSTYSMHNAIGHVIVTSHTHAKEGVKQSVYRAGVSYSAGTAAWPYRFFEDKTRTKSIIVWHMAKLASWSYTVKVLITAPNNNNNNNNNNSEPRLALPLER